MVVLFGCLAVQTDVSVGQGWRGQDPGVDGAGAAVAIVGVEVCAFVVWRGVEAHLFVAAGCLEFVIAAHVGDSRLADLCFNELEVLT